MKEKRLKEILDLLIDAGHPEAFGFDVVQIARNDRAMLGLLELWAVESDLDERSEIIADIEDQLEDDREFAGLKAPNELPKVPYAEFDWVIESVAEFKKKLKAIVEKKGGVSAVAKKAGIPQPSLSRLLNDGRMPRKTTLNKIAVALDLTQTDVASEFTR